MPKRTQLYRVNATTMNTLIGLNGEAIVNTTRKSLHIHDGATPGGYETARADMSNVPDASASAPGRMSIAQVNLLAQTQSVVENAAIFGTCGARLSLNNSPTGITMDVSSPTTTMWLVPVNHNRIPVYDSGTGTWKQYIIGDSISGSFAGIAADKVFDIFLYVSGSTPTLEFLAWSTTTSRATSLTLKDGVLVKNGDPTRLYLGTAYRDASGCVDDLDRRWLWNFYNRYQRYLYDGFGFAASWTYSLAAYRVINARTVPSLSFVLGISGCRVNLEHAGVFDSSTATLRNCFVGIAVNNDIATPSTSDDSLIRIPASGSNVIVGCPRAIRNQTFGAGLSVVWPLERGNGVDTQTWYGVSGNIQSGIFGDLEN